MKTTEARQLNVPPMHGTEIGERTSPDPAAHSPFQLSRVLDALIMAKRLSREQQVRVWNGLPETTRKEFVLCRWHYVAYNETQHANARGL